LAEVYRVEAKDHLFFDYSFSKRIWKNVMERCLIDRQIGDWEEELSWVVKKLKGKSFQKTHMQISMCCSDLLYVD
jgi:hypothetical protein